MPRTTITEVQKRDGRVVPFDRLRIENAIFKAAKAIGDGESREWAAELSWKVVDELEKRFSHGDRPGVEQIQDIVEEVLIHTGHAQISKAYILYREQRSRIRETRRLLLDGLKLVDDYLERTDWRVNENANMNYSLQGLNFYVASSIAARYWLQKIYPPEVQRAHTEGDFHVHDLGVLAAYCCGWDLQDLLFRGFGGVTAKIESKPPRHLRSALGQAVNFFYTLQGETAGAQAFSNFDTLLAPFVRYDGLSYPEVKQALQEFVFNVNVPTRVGFQSLVWDELVVVKRRGRIEVVEIGRLVDEQFKRNAHRVLGQGNGSYAVSNTDDIQALAFDGDGQVVWSPIEAFVRHRVPQGAAFVRVRTSRGTARVSPAHSLFAFEALDGGFTPRPMTARDVDVVHGNAGLTPTNHFIAVRQAPNGGIRDALDLVELIDAIPQVAARTLVRVPDPAQAVRRLRQRVRETLGGFTPFYLEYGIKDKGCWKRWTQNGTLPYPVWRALGGDEPEAEFALRNSDLWYGRSLDGERLGEFVRLLAWYITEGHNDVTNGLYVSQARGGNEEEMARVMGALGALGRVEEMRGWSAQGNPTSTVLRMAGKGLLAALIGYVGGTYSTNKVIPWFVYDLTPELQELFISTLMRGDGSEYAERYDYHTTSKKLSLGLSLLLAMNGYKFSVYEITYERGTWKDQYILRIYKDKDAAERYAVGDLLARVCTRRETFAYEREYEYDLSVDAEMENFAGGSGLLCFHNTPFTNITMDLIPPATLRDTPVIVGGELQDETYGDFQDEMDMINRAFAEIMLEGDAKGRVFTFPIPTYNIFEEFDWENPTLKPVWQMTAKYGIPYFCLEANTPVLRDDHTVTSIESLCPGDRLLDEHGKPVEVTAVFSQQVGEAIHVELENGEKIIATPSHCFPTQDGIKMAQELSLTDKLQRASFSNIWLELCNLRLGVGECHAWFHLFRLTPDLGVDECNADEVQAGQVVYLRPKAIPDQDPTLEFLYKRNNYDANSQQIRVPPVVTPQFCRFLGYLVGNGYYAKRNGLLSFVSADEVLLSDFTICLDDLFGVRYSIGQAGKSTVARQVSVNSVVLRDLLRKVGLSNVTARQKVVPFIIYRCSASGIANFIRGLFDTDGSIDKRGRVISFFSASHTLVRQVQVLLLRLGIMSPRRVTTNGSQLTITGNNIDRFAKQIGFTSPRKRQRLTEREARYIKNSLGDPLLEHNHQLDRLVDEGRLPRHYRYLTRKPKYRGRFYRIPASGLADLFPGCNPPLADVVADRQARHLEDIRIARLARVSGNCNVVDVSVDSATHLFTLGNGILSHNSNFINSDMKPEDARSMCCRLRLDNRELRKRGGGLFAANPLTGSVGVVTLNIPRIGYLATSENDFFARLEQAMEVAKTSLDIKRKILERLTDEGLYPYSRHYLDSVKERMGVYWSNHFSTIALIGMNEGCLNFLGVNVANPEGKAFAMRVLHFMLEKLQDFQEETSYLYNLEASPAESASYRLAKADKARYPDIITAGTGETPYYTNSTHLPVGFTDDIFEALGHQEDLQVLYTGGTVFHGFLGEQIDDWRQARLLVRRIAENFRLPYYTLTPTFSVCPVHGYIPGEHPYCPREHSEEELEKFGVIPDRAGEER